jgi:hypothetical protein
VLSIQRSLLPEGALLAFYRAGGSYTDCYVTDIASRVSHEDFVTSFYTTWVFKLERWLIRLGLSKPSSDAQAHQLAHGALDEFAAWRVERRAVNQLLMADYTGRTRSWLMVEHIATDRGVRTRLYFGSAVVPVRHRRNGIPSMGWTYKSLLGFHKLYSIVLLRAAKKRLGSTRFGRRTR